MGVGCEELRMEIFVEEKGKSFVKKILFVLMEL